MMPRWTTENTMLEETTDGPRLLSRATGAPLGQWAGMRPATLPRRVRHMLAVDDVNFRRHAPTLAARYPDAGAVDGPTVGLVTDDELAEFRATTWDNRKMVMAPTVDDLGFYCLMGSADDAP
jgi:hypothetical protein